jgi:hypothetical protein
MNLRQIDRLTAIHLPADEQRDAKRSEPTPRPLAVGDRVVFGDHQGEVLSVPGDIAVVLCGSKRWRVAVVALARA